MMRHLIRTVGTARAACLSCLLALLAITSVSAQTTSPTQWDADIAAFAAQDEANPPTRGGVVFTGSSSIRMWTTLAEDFPGIDVINRGFGGSEIRDATRHAARLIAPHKPRLVVLYAGDNDLMSGRTPRQLERDFIDFVERVRRIDGNLRIAYIAIKPSPARLQLLDAARSANQRIERATEKLKGVDYIDIFTPMLDAAGAPRADLFLEDQLHLNAEGYRLWTKLVKSYLR